MTRQARRELGVPSSGAVGRQHPGQHQQERRIGESSTRESDDQFTGSGVGAGVQRLELAIEVVTLAEFLDARISDDEMRARPVVGEEAHPGDMRLRLARIGSHDALTVSAARVLAECQAKRAVVAACMGDDPDQGELDPKFLDERVPALVLRALALPYSDHPDYDEAWKP